MGEYVVFGSSYGGDRHDPVEVQGYLNALADSGVIGRRTIPIFIFHQEDIGMLLNGDAALQAALKSSHWPFKGHFAVIRALVRDRGLLHRCLPDLERRYAVKAIVYTGDGVNEELNPNVFVPEHMAQPTSPVVRVREPASLDATLAEPAPPEAALSAGPAHHGEQ